MQTDYDVIVVGGGPGGLTSAAIMAKWGLRTLLIDQNTTPGGKAVTAERDGFRYELGPKLQCPMRGPGFEKAFNMLGIADQLQPIYLDASIGAECAYRKGSWDSYKKSITTVEGASGDQDPSVFFDLWELNEKEQERAMAILAEVALMPPEKMIELDELTFDDYLARQEDVPASLYWYLAMHANASLAEPIDLVSAYEQAAILQQIATGGGGGYYKGGFGRVLGDLARAIEAGGVEMKMGVKVEKIEIEDGFIKGVVTNDGRYTAPVVLSDAGIQPTVLKLAGEEYFDKNYVNYVRSLVPGWSFTGVRYFLNKRVMKSGMYMMWSDDSVVNMERFIRMRSGEIPEEVIMFITVPSNYDTTMAPPDKQCLIAGTICSPDPEAAEISMLYDKMDELMNRLYPEAMDAVYEKETEGPADISRHTRDNVLPGQGGECVGLAQIVGQCGRYKPSQRTPVNGLFIVGGDAGGVGMGTHQASESGINGANLALMFHRKRQAAGRLL
ncbi:MAG: FAD-dependent oxidoreductase [Dehalococcoidia bacterium]